ncbi:MAG: sulfatase-like hydrolase/transferase [Deltaproteobacteria bacterium]|nr:sulfatase-like hydrolase/transferase [Deltaproteobacteria bacterium]
MKNIFRTGVFAGLSAGLFIGLIELCVAIVSVRSSGASFPGILLAPFFYWGLLLPAGALAGAAISLLYCCWYEGDALELRAGSINEIARFRKGSLKLLGWFWGILLAVCGVCAAGTLLHLYFEEVFNNQMLIGLVLVFSICILELVWFSLVRLSMYSLGILLVKLRAHSFGSWLNNVTLSIASISIIIAVLLSGIYIFAPVLSDIGPSVLLWLSALPLIMIVSIVCTVMLAPRWQSLRRVDTWLIALPVCGFMIAVGLGEINAVRQAALVTDTPATKLMTLYRVLSDVDGDGSSGLFGGPDCAPFDSAIGPHATEIPGNGIDENCVMGDAAYSREFIDHELVNTKAFSKPPESFPKRPNLVLITVDALRADHMGLHGYKRPTSPQIDRHAKQAVVFDRAYSQGTGTISSMPSVFTGKFSYQLNYIDDRMPPAISPRETTLAEHLKAAGYTTLGVQQIHYTLKGRWRLLQGFDHVDKTLAHKKPIADRRTTSPETLKIALELLKRGQKDKKPFFLWTHFYDLHSSYLEHPGQKSFGKKTEDRYDGELLFTDKYVGKLLDELLGPGKPPTVVILASDHGDGFRSDRGRNNHAYGLFNELISVPLIVWAPGAKPRRVDTPVGNVDITPTLLNAVGLNKPYLRGHSLFPYLYEGYRDPDRLVFSEKTFGRGKRKRYRKSATGMRWKMIRWITEKKEFMFDLKKDPKEKRNVVSKHRKVAAKLRKHIDIFLERNSIDTLDLEQGKDKKKGSKKGGGKKE